MPQRDVVLVIFDGFQSLDLTGPYEVFGEAGYRRRVVAPAAGPVRSWSGLPVAAELGVADVPAAGIDTLIVAGGRGVPKLLRNEIV